MSHNLQVPQIASQNMNDPALKTWPYKHHKIKYSQNRSAIAHFIDFCFRGEAHWPMP